jgi:hypothetical protein
MACVCIACVVCVCARAGIFFVLRTDIDIPLNLVNPIIDDKCEDNCEMYDVACA